MSAEPRGGGVGRALSGLAVGLGCLLLLGGFVLTAVLYQPYTVPTDSMAPTVRPGDRVLAQRIDGGEVRRGDVVVFREAEWGDSLVIKRVVGVGGDTVACCDEEGRLSVNGRAVEEPYLAGEHSASSTSFEARVPEDELFLMGDYRENSLDSRSRITESDPGTVPRSAVSGRVEATVWPLGRAGLLPGPSGFADLPGGVSGQGPLPPLFWATAGGAVLILGGALGGPLAGRRARSRRRDVRASAVAHNEGTHG